MADIKDLEIQIANLPKGYVIEKVINDKKYFYLQWKENGKTKNRCITEEEAHTIRPQIEERKKLQKELKALKRSIPVIGIKDKFSEPEEPAFKMTALFGDNLIRMAKSAERYEKRECFSKIQYFLNAPAADKVCLVFGLRRTGKTTLLKQLVLSLNEEEQ